MKDSKNKKHESTNEENQNEQLEKEEMINSLLEQLGDDAPEDLKNVLTNMVETLENNKTFTNKSLRGIANSNLILQNRNWWLDGLVYALLTFIVTISLQGYLRIFTYQKFYYIIIFLGAFALLECLFKKMVLRFFPATVLKTFNILLIVISVLTFTLTYLPAYYLWGVGVSQIGLALVALAIVVVLRVVLNIYIKRR